MAAVEIDVKYVAHLARLGLTQAEEEKLGGEVTAAERKLSKLRIAD